MMLTSTIDARILIAEYSLGLLDNRGISQAHTLLGQQEHANAALEWESRLLELVDLLPPIAPPASLLRDVQSKLGHRPAPVDPLRSVPVHVAPVTSVPSHHEISTPTLLKRNEAAAPLAPAAAAASVRPVAPVKPMGPVAMPKKVAESTTSRAPPQPTARPRKPLPVGSIWMWRALSIVLGVIVIAYALEPSEPVVPPVTILEVAPTQVAILQAPGQSSTPGWVVTVDPKGNILMDPHVRSDIPAEASAQLWTRNKHAPQPRSLGLIDPNKPVTIPASLMGPIEPDQLFEITQEASEGSPTGSPAGPILFIGRVVVFGASTTP